MKTAEQTKHTKATECPGCGKAMLLHFAKNPFRPIIACADCGFFVANDGQVKFAVDFTVSK